MRLSVGSGSAFLVEPDFDFLSYTHKSFFPLLFSDGSDRPCVVLFSSVLLQNLRFSAFVFPMCETEKNKKALQQFFEISHFSSLSAPRHLIPILSICQIFFFIGHRLNAKRSAPAFHLLTPICPDFSAIAKSLKNLPKISETGCFR